MKFLCCTNLKYRSSKVTCFTSFALVYVKQEKLKEKKPTMSEALTQTLEAMHKSGCIALLDVIEG